MGANGSTGPESVAAAEKSAALLTARAGARDLSAIPSICRVSAALQYHAGSMPNQGRPIVRTKCLRIAPTGRSWAAATTEGVLIYSIDESFVFDPTDLDMDVTPEAVDAALTANQPEKALLLTLRLNEDSLIRKRIVSINPVDIPAVASLMPTRYLRRMIEALSDLLENCPHVEFILCWCQELCKAHGHYIQQNSRSLLPALRSLQKAITRLHQDLADTCSPNEYLLRYLCSTGSKSLPPLELLTKGSCA